MIDNLTTNRELFNRDNRRDQLTLTLKMTTAQVVNNNSPIQDYTSTRTIIHNLLLNWLLVGSNRSQHYNNDHKLISVASFVTFPVDLDDHDAVHSEPTLLFGISVADSQTFLRAKRPHRRRARRNGCFRRLYFHYIAKDAFAWSYARTRVRNFSLEISCPQVGR